MNAVSLGTIGVVQVGETKYQKEEGENDQNAYIYCDIACIYIHIVYIKTMIYAIYNTCNDYIEIYLIYMYI